MLARSVFVIHPTIGSSDLPREVTNGLHEFRQVGPGEEVGQGLSGEWVGRRSTACGGHRRYGDELGDRGLVHDVGHGAVRFDDGDPVLSHSVHRVEQALQGHRSSGLPR
jgi:hypothetical protein